MSTQEVSDKPAESGIKINNILTALLLASVFWVGNSIESIKIELAKVTAIQLIGKDRLENHEQRILKLEQK